MGGVGEARPRDGGPKGNAGECLASSCLAEATAVVLLRVASLKAACASRMPAVLGGCSAHPVGCGAVFLRAHVAWQVPKPSWVASCDAGIATPGISTSLSYFDQYRRENLPANLVQVKSQLSHAFTMMCTECASCCVALNSRLFVLSANEPWSCTVAQAQRDFFGSHTYERNDGQEGWFHTVWSAGQSADSITTQVRPLRHVAVHVHAHHFHAFHLPVQGSAFICGQRYLIITYSFAWLRAGL